MSHPRGRETDNGFYVNHVGKFITPAYGGSHFVTEEADNLLRFALEQRVHYDHLIKKMAELAAHARTHAEVVKNDAQEYLQYKRAQIEQMTRVIPAGTYLLSGLISGISSNPEAETQAEPVTTYTPQGGTLRSSAVQRDVDGLEVVITTPVDMWQQKDRDRALGGTLKATRGAKDLFDFHDKHYWGRRADKANNKLRKEHPENFGLNFDFNAKEALEPMLLGVYVVLSEQQSQDLEIRPRQFGTDGWGSTYSADAIALLQNVMLDPVRIES